jgi:molecular chaperone HscB
MNYFELYGLPVLMKVETEAVHKTYESLSRKFHPDLYTGEGKEQQTEAAEKLSQVQHAYSIFRNQDETIKYVLQLKNLYREDEVYDMDPDFLAEVADINKKLAEPEIESNVELLNEYEQRTKDILAKIYADVAKIIEYYQEGLTSEKELLQVKDYYYQKKYLQHILDRIYQIRNIASHF